MSAGFGKSELAFCLDCGNRVEEDPYGLTCPEHGEVSNSDVQWRICTTLNGYPEHINDVQ